MPLLYLFGPISVLWVAKPSMSAYHVFGNGPPTDIHKPVSSIGIEDNSQRN